MGLKPPPTPPAEEERGLLLRAAREVSLKGMIGVWLMELPTPPAALFVTENCRTCVWLIGEGLLVEIALGNIKAILGGP